MPVGIGSTLGGASGSIVLDISQLQTVRTQVRVIGRDIDQALAGIGTQGTRGLNQLGQSARQATGFLGGLRGELVAIGAASSLATGFGLSAARDVRNYTAAFKQFTGSQLEASKLMGDLTKKANQFGLEIDGVWQLGRSLLPVLKGNTDELDKWVTRAALLRSVFPTAQKGAETRAISEFTAGQTMSLQRLFNVPPSLIQEAKKATSDIGAQMDYILQKMGATEQGATAMANGFVSVQNELRLVAAAGFGPLLEAMTPVLHGFAEWLTQLRETNPAVLKFGAGILSIAAVGAPTLLFLNQLVIAAEKLKLLGALGGLGKLGLYGAAIGGGFAAGVKIDQSIGKATGWQSFQNITVQGELQKFGHALELVAAHVWEFASALTGLLATMHEAMARFSALVGDKTTAAAHNEIAGAYRSYAEETRIGAQNLRYGGTAMLTGDRDDASRYTRASRPSQIDIPTEAINEWATNVKRIETQANQQRLEATRQYESQRTQAIQQYELSLSREAEDFAISRQRQAADLAANIASIQADSARQAERWARDLAASIAKAQADSAERVAKIQADGNKRLAELDADYNKSRERAARDHANNLLEAAGNLDARAVAAEQKRYAESSKDAADAHDDAVKKEKDTLAERIAEEQASLSKRIDEERKANDQRLADAAEADNRRIADAQQALARQQAQEDQDRALRLARGAEDQANQLAQMAQAHSDRMDAITAQETAEKKQADDAFNRQLEAAGLHNAAWLRDQKIFENEALKRAREFWKAQLELIPKVQGPTQQPNFIPDDLFPAFADGGPVRATGLAKVHAGEYVLSNAMLANLGGYGAIAQMQRSGGRNSTLNLSDGAIQIFATPGMDASAVASAVRREMVTLLEDLA